MWCWRPLGYFLGRDYNDGRRRGRDWMLDSELVFVIAVHFLFITAVKCGGGIV